jgi:subtilase family serine protease
MSKSRTRARWHKIALSSSLVVLALPATSLVASAANARAVVAGLSPVPSSDVVVNKVITASVDLSLTQRNQSALSAFVASLSNTASANYHDFLTPTQYADRYGASTQTVDTVRSYLKGYGLSVGSLSTGRDILHVSGTTTDLARAFDASVVTVRLSDGSLGAHFTSTGSLPQSLAKDVTAVAGLSSTQSETTSITPSHAVASPTTCAATTSTTTTPNAQGGYNVQQQSALYGLSAAWAAGDTGVGQTIGIYELSTYNANDVATFASCYGLIPQITSINVDGGPTNADNAGSAPDEATLDVEETSALAPGAAIDVYQGTNNGSGPTDVYSMMASQDTATIITTSWGICEAQTDGGAQTEQTIFQEMAAQGQTVVAASGDDGSSDCEGVPSGASAQLAVDDPSSQPYVTGVGGLTVSNTSPLSEAVWNDNCTASDCGASGGGVSSLWSQPTWQNAPGITTTAATGGMRMVPDLSVMGDPATGFVQYYTGSDGGSCRQNCQGGWGAIGGTSIGAPIVSSLVAVAAQSCSTLSDGRLGFINPSLYAMASTGFVDVTSGSNDLYKVGDYSAGVGYDMASGLGSPNGAAFIAGLCPSVVSPSSSTFALSSSSGVAGSSGPTVTATLRDASGAPLANTALNVTVSAPAGTLGINGVDNTAATPSETSATVTSNASGVAKFTVQSSLAQSVAVTITYGGQSVYSTTLTFSTTASTKPGAPAISKLSPLVGGFALTLRAPVNTGGHAITSYQYSINSGHSWITLEKNKKSINVTDLSKDAAYRVIVRAINAIGASSASSSRRVVTRS